MTAYPVAAEAMDQEIYFLSALVCGSERLKSIENEMRGLAWVRSTFEASEVSRRIISIAVLLRSHLDSSMFSPNISVGSLMPDSKSPSAIKQLLLRDACNKIIHADEVDIYCDDTTAERAGALSSQIELLGSLNGKQWIAKVDILKFLNAASNHS